MNRGKAISKALLFAVAITITTSTAAYSALGVTLENRLGGMNRYDTAAEICKDEWRGVSDVAVLATGENFPDALSAAPLAKKFNAPILLTEKEEIPQSTLNQLIRLQVKKVYIIGGTGVISSKVESMLQFGNIETERLAGATRYETAIEIAKKVGLNSREVVIANGYEFADALSISAIAAKKQMPMLLTSKEEMPKAVADFLSTQNIDKSYVLGGSDQISDAVFAKCIKGERILGQDKYERNINTLKKFEGDLKFESIGIATGKDFPDALAGSAMAAMEGFPIVLVDDADIKQTTLEYVKGKKMTNTKFDVFGLTGAVKEDTVNKLSGEQTTEELPQFSPVKAGEEIAVMNTSKGSIKIRFFPQYAPEAVQNFKVHAKEGYYNGLTFHRVIKDFMIQGGDPNGNGTGGQSIWKAPFGDEFSTKLHNFRGALSMANSGPNTNGSQFFVVQNSKVDPTLLQQMESADKYSYSEGVIRKYGEVGGTPWLDYKHTVFGQVFDGMDVVDAIANVETVKDIDKPVENIIIQSIELVPYTP